MMNFETGPQPEPKDKAWEKQQGMMEKIYDQGAEGFLRDAEGMDKAFETEKKCVCCMDEGTAHMDIKGKFEMAGSGILYPAASWEERLDKVADLLLDMGIEEVTSHEGCGAAKLACKRDGIQTEDPDAYGKKWSKDLQRALQAKKSGQETVSYHHIEAGKMVRDKDFHEARVAWFDATGKFNPGALGENAPLGFVIDYKHDTQNAIKDEEKVYPFVELRIALLDIAFKADHGFGQKFDVSNPFVVVVMGEEGSETDMLKERVTKFIDGLGLSKEMRSAIRIDGFSVKPVEELKVAA
jgi:hypothetical protein